MSSLVRITSPAVLPLSLAEVKSAARLEGMDEDDALVASYLRSAVEQLDGAAGILGMCLISQQWRLTIDRFPISGVITIPLPPLQSVDALTYVDAAGDEQSILDYTVYGIGAPWQARLSHAFNGGWPTARRQDSAITVTFTAGYGDSWNDVPHPIRQAITVMVAAAYDGCPRAEEVDSLLGPYRMRVW